MKSVGKIVYAVFCALMLIAGGAVILTLLPSDVRISTAASRSLGKDGIFLCTMGVCGLLQVSGKLKGPASKLSGRHALAFVLSEVVFAAGAAAEIWLIYRPGGNENFGFVLGMGVQLIALAGMALSLKIQQKGACKDAAVEKDRRSERDR